MSAFNDYGAADPEFTLIGPGLNASNMRSRGWLDESRVWKVSGDKGDETIELRPLARHDLRGFLAAQMPGGYLVELRVQEGWDAGIPRPAVLVHRFEGGHSYLMRGNSGSADLIAGDSFGDAEPEPDPMSILSSFSRVDVLSIDAAGRRATLRIRHHTPVHVGLSGQAVDPMYLILHGAAYLKWVELHHPHEPKVTELQAALRALSREEQDAALSRARALQAHGKAVEEAIAELRS